MNKRCSICGNLILREPSTGWDQGHNAQPVKNGRCCNFCNGAVVIPARIRLILEQGDRTWDKPDYDA